MLRNFEHPNQCIHELGIKLEMAVVHLSGSTGSITITEDTIVLFRDGCQFAEGKV